jgi:hypothetical protein
VVAVAVATGLVDAAASVCWARVWSTAGSSRDWQRNCESEAPLSDDEAVGGAKRESVVLPPPEVEESVRFEADVAALIEVASAVCGTTFEKRYSKSFC